MPIDEVKNFLSVVTLACGRSSSRRLPKRAARAPFGPQCQIQTIIADPIPAVITMSASSLSLPCVIGMRSRATVRACGDDTAVALLPQGPYGLRRVAFGGDAVHPPTAPPSNHIPKTDGARVRRRVKGGSDEASAVCAPSRSARAPTVIGLNGARGRFVPI